MKESIFNQDDEANSGAIKGLIFIALLLLVTLGLFYTNKETTRQLNLVKASPQVSGVLGIATTQKPTPKTQLIDYSDTTAFSMFTNNALAWAADARAYACNGTTSQTTVDWKCFFYSAKIARDASFSINAEGVVTMEIIKKYTPGKETVFNGRYFFDLNQFTNPAKVVNTAVENGLNLESNVVSLHLGIDSLAAKYQNQPVWELREYDQAGEIVRAYQISATNFQLLSVINQ